MGTPSRCIDAHASLALDAGWSLLRAEPGAYAHPDELPEHAWRAVGIRATVAALLQADVADARRLDAFDWWFRCEIAAVESAPGVEARLRFEGLATLAHAWVDGQPVLQADNMHRCYVAAVPEARRAGTRILVLRFASLRAALEVRRPRPRWKTALVDSQGLRWFRTTLLGRMPSWNPRIDVVGPWRPVELELPRAIDVQWLQAAPRLRAGVAVLRLGARWRDLGGGPWTRALLRVGDFRYEVDGRYLRGDGIEPHEVEVPGAEPWWPHTHGRPVLYGCRLELQGAGGNVVVDCGELGFKSFEILDAHAALRMRCNGESLFLRGACWTSADLRLLEVSAQALESLLARVVDAGMNMLRIVGTATYASDALLAACDRLGILLWQDFAFANLDYPLDDEAFAAEAHAEAREAVERLSRHACVAVYCGNSEVEQQAAMLGLPRQAWTHAFFRETLPALVADAHPASAYVRSSPSGGELPFHIASGVAHDYGVGAYRRPVREVRLAGLRFAAECLGFSNVPMQASLDKGPLAGLAPHDPRWKAGVPRDAGAGWDFEDVRDHYFGSVVGADPHAMRIADPRGYLRWSSLVSAELMAAAFTSWRAPDSGCQGALVWLLQDLAPGAGWGVLEASGVPKPAYWALRRCLAPRAVLIEDRGLEGCDFIVLNDAPLELAVTLDVELWTSRGVRTLRARRALRLDAHGALRVGAADLFGHFVDINDAYRFGPPAHDAVVARIVDGADRNLSEAFFFPRGLGTEVATSPLRARLERDGDDRWLQLECDSLLLGLEIEAPGFEPEENAFHLAPGRVRCVRLRATAAAPATSQVRCSAANLRETVTVRDD